MDANGNGATQTLAPPTTIRIVLIEDHDMVAAALGSVLASEDDFELVERATTLSAGFDAVGRHRPTVVITDLRLPDGVVTERLHELQERAPEAEILVYTGAPSEQAAMAAFEADVRGFVSKTQRIDDLIDAVRRVARHETVVAPELLPVLVARLDPARVGTGVTLTRREIEILHELARGRGTSAIAGQLHLSANTIRNHISRILSKLRVHSRLEAVSEASRRGIIAPVAPY